jgi:hypothetical protein
MDFVGQVARGTLWVRPIVNRPAVVHRNSRIKPRAIEAQLMTNRITHRYNRPHRLFLSLAGIAAIAIRLINAPQLRAQSQDMSPSFEAASIKPAQMTGQGASIDRHPGMLLMKNVTLQDCIREAYGVTDSQIARQDRLGSDRYDVTVQVPPSIFLDFGSKVCHFSLG